MKKYTILVITHNDEKNIKRCLDSIINLEYINYNVLIIDSNSHDKTKSIVNKYISEYPDLISFIDTKYSIKEEIINFAISSITSEYFLYLEPNDVLTPTLLQCIDATVDTKVDIVSFLYYIPRYIDNFNILDKNTKQIFSVCSGKQAYINLCKNMLSTFCNYFGYIFRVEFFKEHKFEFIHNNELLSMTKLLLNAESVISTDVYGYIHNKKEIALNNKYSIDMYLNEYIKINEEIYNNNFLNEQIEIIFMSIILSCLNLSSNIKDKKYFYYFIDALKKYDIYKVIPKMGFEKRIHRLYLKHFPIIPVIYYLTFIYFDDYNIKDIYLNRFLYFVRETTYKKFSNIMKIKNYRILRFRKNIFFFSSIFKNLPLLINKKSIHIHYFELPITTKCTLNCKNCANLIPCYTEKECSYNINVDYLEKEINMLFKLIKSIATFRILGGEPFLHPNLGQVIKMLLKTRKIKNKIVIVTNGTILPNSNLIKILKNKKVEICISNYGKYSYNKDKLIELCKENHIAYTISTLDIQSEDYFWVDFGYPIKLIKTKEQLTKQFKKCNSLTKTLNLLNGKIYLCSHCAYGHDLNIIKCNDNDYVDILSSTLTLKNKRKKIQNLIYNKTYINACNYCNIGSNKANKIKVALQKNWRK